MLNILNRGFIKKLNSVKINSTAKNIYTSQLNLKFFQKIWKSKKDTKDKADAELEKTSNEIFSDIEQQLTALRQKQAQRSTALLAQTGHPATTSPASGITSSTPTTSLQHRRQQLQLERRLKRDAFTDAIDIYLNRYGKTRRGHVQFIRSALRRMRAHGVHKDLSVYKRLFGVFPGRGVMVARSLWQVEFEHYPVQQDCAIHILVAMEMNGVMPDDELGHIILALFGRHSHVITRFERMLYWLPKLQATNPWPVPWTLPDAEEEACDPVMQRATATRVIRRLNPDPLVSVQTRQGFPLDCVASQEKEDITWMISATSPIQHDLLKFYLKYPPLRSSPSPIISSQASPSNCAVTHTGVVSHSLQHTSPPPTLVLEGPLPIWMRHRLFHYFQLSVETHSARLREHREAVRRVEHDMRFTECAAHNTRLIRHAWPRYFDPSQTPHSYSTHSASSSSPSPPFSPSTDTASNSSSTEKATKPSDSASTFSSSPSSSPPASPSESVSNSTYSASSSDSLWRSEEFPNLRSRFLSLHEDSPEDGGRTVLATGLLSHLTTQAVQLWLKQLETRCPEIARFEVVLRLDEKKMRDAAEKAAALQPWMEPPSPSDVASRHDIDN